MVAVGGHGSAVAEGVIGIADGIGRAALIGLVAAQVVVVDRHIAEGVGHGDGLAHDVVTVGRDGANGIGGGDKIVLRIVSVNGAVASTVHGGNLTAKGVNLKAVGHARGIHRLHEVPKGVAHNLGICPRRINRDTLGIRAIRARDVPARADAFRLKGTFRRKTRKARQVLLRQGYNVRVGAGLHGGLFLPHVTIAQKILCFTLLFAPLFADRLREGGLRARYIIDIGLHGLARGRDLRHAPVIVIGRQRLQRGAVRAGAGLTDGLAEQVLLRLLPTRSRGDAFPQRAIGEDLRLDGGTRDFKKATERIRLADLCAAIREGGGDGVAVEAVGCLRDTAPHVRLREDLPEDVVSGRLGIEAILPRLHHSS